MCKYFFYGDGVEKVEERRRKNLVLTYYDKFVFLI
jgi:hypothetical protein